MTGPRIRPSPRLLDAVSVTLLAGALAAYALPPAGRANTGDRAVLLPAVPAALPPSAAVPVDFDSSYAGIVRGNLFSASRRTPSSRFMPPPGTLAGDMASDLASGVPTADAPDAGLGLAQSSESGSAEGTPSLSGIVTVDGVRRALLSLAPGQPPTLYGVGEGIGRTRVREIRTDRVVLATPGGTRTLRLTRSPDTPADSFPLLP